MTKKYPPSFPVYANDEQNESNESKRRLSESKKVYVTQGLLYGPCRKSLRDQDKDYCKDREIGKWYYADIFE